jgi:catechol 2,3-dioxygenase-like lactoylglutathione lyase family enzyme
MQRTVPMLHIEDYEVAKAYYVDWLGFRIDWEFRFEPTFPVYMQISRQGLVLHLSEHEGDNPGGVKCHVDVDDLDALVAEWKSRRPGFMQEVETMPWNAKHISLKDPFGNELGINQVLPVTEDLSRI